MTGFQNTQGTQSTMKVLVTGATGFIGSRLVRQLVACGHDVVVLSRNPDFARGRFARIQLEGTCRSDSKPLHFFGWDSLHSPPSRIALDGVDVVVHLAGESIAARWTEDQKKKIRESRMIGTKHLVQALATADSRPRVLISASAIGFYGDRGDERLDENASAGSGFLSEVCRDWEREALEGEKIEGLRVVRLRTGLVMGNEGGTFPLLRNIFRWGGGGSLGTGRQWMSWIHVEDLVSLIEWAWKHPDIEGVLNAVSPHPVTNREFSTSLAKALSRPSWVPAPAIALKLALGEMSDLLLQSQRVVPRRPMEYGFAYRYEKLDAAFSSLLGSR